MKKTLFFLVFLLFAVGCGEDDETGLGGTVYICTGKGAYAYHSNSSCRGLNNYQAEIVSTTLKQAKKKRSACNSPNR